MIQLNLNKNKRYLLACSYGPDSMALFSLLKEQGYSFDAAIVNYHLRKESNSEVAGLIKYASKNKVKVFVKDVKEVPQKNIEATCRKIRYEFFKELVDENHYDAVLVAHHQDDLIETYLLQKNRQNHPIFYGISENTVINGVQIIRPLLSCSKAELLEYCNVNNVPYSVDKTNFDQTIKRNKIRHQIVSKMSNKERNDLIAKIKNENDGLKAIFSKLENIDLSSVSNMLSLAPIEQAYALNKLVAINNINSYFSKDNVGHAISILKSKKPNGTYLIKRNIYLVKEYDHFYLSKTNNATFKPFSFLVDKPSKFETAFFFLDFTGETSNRNVSLSDYPLVIRNAYKDDVVFIKGYKVEVRRLFIDWKMPLSLRKKWPVIINKDNKIIYIPRYQKDFKPDSNCNFYVKQ